jgi:hypothetical protein
MACQVGFCNRSHLHVIVHFPPLSCVRLGQLTARQDELQAAISHLHQVRSTSQLSSPRNSTTSAARPSMSIMRSAVPLRHRITFTAKIAPIGLEYFSNKGFISPANHNAVLDM